MKAGAKNDWTNPSVLELAKDADPVEVITQRAREVVASAIDEGWAGPPFDIFALADRLKIGIAARDDIKEARTVPTGRSSFTIEFNPNRPHGRMRYSIAHEIAHTLFPDCHKMIRNRSSHDEMKGDDWQLEALCNIAAAEFLMPMGTLQDTVDEALDIDHLLTLRKVYDVSAEALLIRIARISSSPVAAFVASRIEKGEGLGRYRLDYMIGSREWGWQIARNRPLPATTRIAECSAIGYTAKGDEKWPFIAISLHIECVGIPPYPGSTYPRVVGIATPKDHKPPQKPAIVYLKGNALEPRGEGKTLIVHVVNDKTPNWGGSGFAQAVRSCWPEVQVDFKRWAESHRADFALGNIHLSKVDPKRGVVSMICQKGYGPSPRPRIRYAALRDALEKLAHVALREESGVHMPRIGAGQAGGSWSIISELIELQLCARGIPVTVYDLPSSVSREESQVSLNFGA